MGKYDKAVEEPKLQTRVLVPYGRKEIIDGAKEPKGEKKSASWVNKGKNKNSEW